MKLPKSHRTEGKGGPTGRKIPFMDVPGSDPSSAMKNDNAQFVKGSTKPGTKPKKPQKTGAHGYVGSKQFGLPKQKPKPGEL